MKKISTLCLMVALIMLNLQSCQDKFLEIEPKTNDVEGNAYQTEEDAFLALVSVYDAMSHQETLNFEPYRSDVFSDDTYAAGEPPSGGMVTRWQNMERSILDALSPTSEEAWKRCYRGIYRANQFLAKEKEIKWKSVENKERFIAEVKFLRAYFYWDLVRDFGWVPLVDDLISTSEEARNYPQSEPIETYTYIAKNLMEAIPNLPVTVAPNEVGRASKSAAQILMARVYLYYQGFGKNELGFSNEWTNGSVVIDANMIKKAMEDIINGQGGYKLLSNYRDIHAWENQNNEESIFEIQYSGESNISTWDNSEQNNGNTISHISAPRNPIGDSTLSSGWSFGTITWSLYNEFEPNDPRLGATIYNANDSLTSFTAGFHNTGYFNNKYMALKKYASRTSEPTHNYPKNHIDMRLAEVYLIAAELYLNDDNAKATNYLNIVRTRSMGSSSAKSSITIDDIYHERRVEFACEGLRYMDLLRRGLDYTKQKIDASYIPDPSYVAPDEFVGFVFDIGHKGMLPIPDVEIRNANQGILEQKIDFYK